MEDTRSIGVGTKAYEMLLTFLKRVDIICVDGVLDGTVLHFYKDCPGLIGLLNDTIFEEDESIEIDLRDMRITTEGMEETIEYLEYRNFNCYYNEKNVFLMGSFSISLMFFDKFCMENVKKECIECFKHRYAWKSRCSTLPNLLVWIKHWDFVVDDELYKFIIGKMTSSEDNIGYYKKWIVKLGVKRHVQIRNILLDMYNKIPFCFYDYVIIQVKSAGLILDEVEKAIKPFDKIVYMRGKELSFVRNISPRDVKDLYKSMNHLKHPNNETVIIKDLDFHPINLGSNDIPDSIKERFGAGKSDEFFTFEGLVCLYINIS